MKYRGMYRKPIEASDQLIVTIPDDAIAHYNLGVSYGKSGMHKEAVEAFKLAIGIKSDFVDAFYNLGIAYTTLGMFRKAIKVLTLAVRMKPDDEDALFNLGLIHYIFLHNREPVLEIYDILKSLKSERANELYNLLTGKHVT